MSALIVLGSHPYWRRFKPSVHPTALEWAQGPGEWAVAWRDFFTVRDIEFFPTQAAALAFAARLYAPPLIIDDVTIAEVGWESVAECDRFWRTQ